MHIWTPISHELSLIYNYSYEWLRINTCLSYSGLHGVSLYRLEVFQMLIWWLKCVPTPVKHKLRQYQYFGCVQHVLFHFLFFVSQQSYRDYNQSCSDVTLHEANCLKCSWATNGQVNCQGAWKQWDNLISYGCAHQCTVMLVSPEWSIERNTWCADVLGIRGGKKQEKAAENRSEKDVRGEA